MEVTAEVTLEVTVEVSVEVTVEVTEEVTMADNGGEGRLYSGGYKGVYEEGGICGVRSQGRRLRGRWRTFWKTVDVTGCNRM